MLVGTKSDLEPERQIETEEAQDLAKKLGIPYMEVSAKTN